jgi:manganese transport protein
MQPWLRRFITRLLAIAPTVATIYWFGNVGTTNLIVFSQVILSLQLPFAVIPLAHFTSDRKRMGVFANGLWLKIGAWGCAAFIVILNVWLLYDQLLDALKISGPYRLFLLCASVVLGIAFFALLGAVLFTPWLRPRAVTTGAVAMGVPGRAAPVVQARTYSRILVSLDHSRADEEALGNAVSLARMHGSKLVLLHVEEGVTSQLFGAQSSTAEIAEGQDYLSNLVRSLREQRIEVDVVVRHGRHPAAEITNAIKELRPDLVIMASHGHKGLKDLFFGTTINAVRHRVRVPLLIVRRPEGDKG